MKHLIIRIFIFLTSSLTAIGFSSLYNKANAQAPVAVSGNYKDWNYSPNAAYGLVKLDNTEKRDYYQVTRVSPLVTRVKEFNAAGINTSTTVVRFVNGKLSLVTITNQWGDTYYTMKFTYVGNNTFNVAITNSGINKLLPCKAEQYIYKNDVLSEARYLSYSGGVCDNTDGVAIIKYICYTDKNRFGQIKEKTFYNTDESPVLSKGYGCYKVVYDLDERSNRLSESYYGVNDEPIADRYGVYTYKYVYDEDDNELEKENIGADDKEVLNNEGVGRLEYTYDDGFAIQETRYNDKNMISRASAVGDGIAIIKYQYDSRGNNTQQSYFDENRQPVNSNTSIQKVVDTYSPYNMLTSEAYFDKYSGAAIDRDSIHLYNYVKSAKNKIIEEAFFGKDNNPVTNAVDRVYMRKHAYDELGREIAESYWKDENTKMNRWDGYHQLLTQYNMDGQEIEYSYYDQNGSLFPIASGYSRLSIIYNKNAKRISVNAYNGNAPAMRNGSALVSHFQSIHYQYDTFGRVSSLEYFDDTQNPIDAVVSLDNPFNCHKIEFIYEGNRIIRENCYQTSNDTPIKIIDCLQNDYVSTSGVSRGYKNN